MHVVLGEARAVEHESPLPITLWQAPCRGDRMDHVIEKATELGVRRIVPWLRNVPSYDWKASAPSNAARTGWPSRAAPASSAGAIACPTSSCRRACLSCSRIAVPAR